MNKDFINLRIFALVTAFDGMARKKLQGMRLRCTTSPLALRTALYRDNSSCSNKNKIKIKINNKISDCVCAFFNDSSGI